MCVAEWNAAAEKLRALPLAMLRVLPLLLAASATANALLDASPSWPRAVALGWRGRCTQPSSSSDAPGAPKGRTTAADSTRLLTEVDERSLSLARAAAAPASAAVARCRPVAAELAAEARVRCALSSRVK